MTAHRYLQLLLVATAVLVAGVVVLSESHVRAPQQGDLARIGGYLQKDYGALDPATYEVWDQSWLRWLDADELTEAGYGDILVLGDSFTRTGRRYNWANELARRTGLRVHAASIASWSNLFDSDGFRANTPSVLILQMVERDALDYLGAMDRKLGDTVIVDSPAFSGVRLQSGHNGVREQLPGKQFEDFEERISITIDYLWKRVQHLIGHIPQNLVELPVSNQAPELFSSAKQNVFVALPEDLASYPFRKSELAAAVSGFFKFRSLARERGFTAVLLVVPNRHTVYRPFLDEHPQKEIPALIDSLTSQTRSFNVLPIIQHAVQSGTADVYWPMDTHMSPVGSALFGHSFTDWLIGSGYLLPNP